MANRDFTKPFYGIERELAFPALAVPGANNQDVRRVQEWLELSGQHTVVDGDFGGGTASSLRGFQRVAGLPPTGTMDQTTWAALSKPLREAYGATPPASADFRARIVFYAKAFAAAHPKEVGGPNDGPYVRSFMLGNGGKEWQWCAGFVCFILAMSARDLGMHLPFVPSFGVPQLARSAQNRGIFNPDGPALPGDVFVIPTATGSWSHTGIVVEWSEPKFTSVEGNTNDEGGSDGEVARVAKRTAAKCDYITVA